MTDDMVRGEPRKTDFSDEELLRYSRHIMLSEVDVTGQLAISNARVLIVGLGGLGSSVGMYLAAAGVGHLVLADDDRVEASNLQRQIVHNEASLGMNKAASAARTLRGLNGGVALTVLETRLADEHLLRQVGEVDLVCDCTDNFATRAEINRACVALAKPLVSGAAIRFEGQLSVFDSRQDQSPCYHCLYPDLNNESLSCSQSGVLSPLVGVIGSAQALEALKVLGSFGRPLIGRLLIHDAAAGSWREFGVARDPECRVCRERPALHGAT